MYQASEVVNVTCLLKKWFKLTVKCFRILMCVLCVLHFLRFLIDFW